jgi:hypothetical protein
MSRRIALVLLAVVALVLGGTYAWSAVVAPTASCTRNPAVTQVTGGSKITVSCVVPNPPSETVTATQTVTATATATVTETVTPAPSSTATATQTSGTWACVVPLGSNCGAYPPTDAIPMSNGNNTYVANQDTGAHGTETVYANSPSDWKVVADLADCGGCVQTYPDVQQLTNDWNGNGWGDCGSTCANTPWRTLSTLKITYDETSPQTGASYQFSPDVWGPGPWDIMFWVDTHGRCNEGAFGPTLLGHLTIDGQTWTAHAYGDEIIIVLDGAGGPGTCAQQSSGTINVKAGLDWLYANGHISGTTLEQINTGWEITQASNATFTVHDYSITAN